MSIRRYETRDCSEIMTLFYDTVHSVNSKDYTADKLKAWAPENLDSNLWNKSFLKNYTIVFILDNIYCWFW